MEKPDDIYCDFDDYSKSDQEGNFRITYRYRKCKKCSKVQMYGQFRNKEQEWTTTVSIKKKNCETLVKEKVKLVILAAYYDTESLFYGNYLSFDMLKAILNEVI